MWSVVFALGLLVPPLAGAAQSAGKAVRIGILRPAPDNPAFRRDFEGFRQALRDGGYAEGTNLTFDYRVRAGSAEELRAIAGELVGTKVDLVLAIGAAGVNAAAKATTSIPIVAQDLETDPVAAGYAASRARPGRNITGVFLDFPELSGKWLQLLKEAIPRLTRVAVLRDPAAGMEQAKAAEAAARSLRLHLQPLEAGAPADFAGAFRAASAARAGAMLALTSPVFSAARKQLADLAIQHRLPMLLPFPGFAADGGLMAYGPQLLGMYRQAGAIAAKILDGAKPADLPVEQPTKFELAVNLKIAKALGLTIPRSILIRADQVIE